MLDFSIESHTSEQNVAHQKTGNTFTRKRKFEVVPTMEHTHKLLKTDERSSLGLDLVSPFYDYYDLWNRLLPFHVFLSEFSGSPTSSKWSFIVSNL